MSYLFKFAVISETVRDYQIETEQIIYPFMITALKIRNFKCFDFSSRDPQCHKTLKT